jgi:hypothetical protein
MRASRVGLPAIVVLVSIVLAPSPARAEGMPMWGPDGVLVSSNSWGNAYPDIASGGADSGTLVAWMQFSGNNPTAFRIFAQRVNDAGIAQWTAGGVVVCGATGVRYEPGVISDGAGGAFVSWADLRGSNDFDVYVQHLNASGTPQWTTNGVAVCTAPRDQSHIKMASDGNGGVILAWWDTRPNGIVYAQRLNAAGIPQWAPDGIPVTSVLADGGNPRMVSDGAGGAIITWYDYRTGDVDLYAQRFNAGGVAQWAADGVALCTAPGTPMPGEIVSDGAGGAIIAWSDSRADPDDIYVQRVSASGQPLWTPNGVPLCTAPHHQKGPVIASDGAAGAIVAWQDERSGAEPLIYAQRVSATGVPQWAADGIAIGTGAESQSSPQIAKVQNGAIVAWEDERSDHYNYYAQHVNLAGIPVWPTDGVALTTGSTAPNKQAWLRIAASGSAGAVATWEDHRTAGYDTIFGQRVVDGPPCNQSCPHTACVTTGCGDDGIMATTACTYASFQGPHLIECALGCKTLPCN